jgi:hypothetical protein
MNEQLAKFWSNNNRPAGDECGEASSFLEACDAHDTCYQTCGSSRISECESVFSNALAVVCAPFSGDCAKDCDDWADAYAGAVGLYGQGAWENAQVAACACCEC